MAFRTIVSKIRCSDEWETSLELEESERGYGVPVDYKARKASCVLYTRRQELQTRTIDSSASFNALSSVLSDFSSNIPTFGLNFTMDFLTTLVSRASCTTLPKPKTALNVKIPRMRRPKSQKPIRPLRSLNLHLPDQTGRVFIITGGDTGSAFLMATNLYEANATVYIASKYKSKARAAVFRIREEMGTTCGKVDWLNLDLSNLSTIQSSVEEFKRLENRLDVLVNWDGVKGAPRGSKSIQGNELHMAKNCLGAFLFTRLLYPVLSATAVSSDPDTVRVCWAGSCAMNASAPPGGIPLDALARHFDPPLDQDHKYRYSYSKAGVNFHANLRRTYNFRHRYSCSKAGAYFYANLFPIQDITRHIGAEKVLNVCFHTGVRGADCQRFSEAPDRFDPDYSNLDGGEGAMTAIGAALAKDLSVAANDQGAWISPFGVPRKLWKRRYSIPKKRPVRRDIKESLVGTEEGGSGVAERFWDWSVKMTDPFIVKKGAG